VAEPDGAKRYLLDALEFEHFDEREKAQKLVNAFE